MNIIRGREILLSVKQKSEPFRELFSRKKVLLVRFVPSRRIEPILSYKYLAAEISAIEKVKILSFINCEVDYVILTNSTNRAYWQQMILAANQDAETIGIIVQNPIPQRLQSDIQMLVPEKDIDGMLENNPLFPASATSEAIARLVQSFAAESSAVAVVGGRGFVGRGVVRLLEQREINCFSLDVGDDLLRTLEADIVVSATGQPELLDERHLKPYHRLVVDAGFVPLENNNILGDVKRSAYDIVQNITPVPGGVGPLQMATLLERLVAVAAGKSIDPWTW